MIIASSTSDTKTTLTFEEFLAGFGGAFTTDNPGNQARLREMYDDELWARATWPTPPACPSYCIEPAGHEYVAWEGPRDQAVHTRMHIAFTAAGLDITSLEKRHADGTVEVVEIGIFVETDELGSVQAARAFLADLTEAVAVLERIQADQ